MNRQKIDNLIRDQLIDIPRDAVEIIDTVLSVILGYAEETHHLSEEQLYSFAEEILKVTIGTAARDTFLEHIVVCANLENDVASDLADEVEERLFELLDVLQIDSDLEEIEKMYEANTTAPSDIGSKPPPASPETPPIPEEIPTQPNEAEDRLHKLRTMEEDAKKVVGYGNYRTERNEDGTFTSRSSQDDLLNGRNSLTNTPSYTDE